MMARSRECSGIAKRRAWHDLEQGDYRDFILRRFRSDYLQQVRNRLDDLPMAVAGNAGNAGDAARMTARTSAAIFSTRSGGVPAGASKPIHEIALKPGSALSARVGTSGRAATRLSPVTASARSLPALMWPEASSTVIKDSCTCLGQVGPWRAGGA